MGSAAARPSTENAPPAAALTRMSREKPSRADCSSPEPIRRATMALPPVASMIPAAMIRHMTGKTMFRAARASSPTKRETNMPSTMV